MRRMLFALIAAVGLAACEETVGPSGDTRLLDDAAVLAYGGMDMADPGSHFIARLHRLPDNLKLSAAQETQIKALIAAFGHAVKADLEALHAIHHEARAAKAAGKTEVEIRAIFAKGDAIRARLHAAEAKLHADIDAVLTADQRAWLASPAARPCQAENVRLTDAQKTQITALIAAFETANRADLDAIKAVHAEARAAHQAGATREQIKAILDKASAAMQRVHAAQHALQAAIDALLTPAQRTSGCYGRK